LGLANELRLGRDIEEAIQPVDEGLAGWDQVAELLCADSLAKVFRPRILPCNMRLDDGL